MDQIPDTIDVASQTVYREERVQQHHLLRRALCLLKVDQQQLITDIYGRGCNLSDVARQQNCSRQSVQQRHKRILDVLREYMYRYVM